MATPTLTIGSLTVQASGTTRTPVLPTHAANDILIACAMCNIGDDMTISGGWTALGSGSPQNNSDMSTGWWWKRAASGAETNPTVTWGAAGSGTNIHAAVAMNASGCVVGDTPYEGENFKGSPTFDNAPKHGSLTTLGTNRLVMGFIFIDAVVSWSNSVLTGWTEVANNTSSTGGGMSYYVLTKSEATATTVAELAPVNSPGTMNTSQYWRTLSLAWRDSAPAGGGSSVPLHNRSMTGVGF